MADSADEQVTLIDHLPQIMAALHHAVAEATAAAAQSVVDDYASNAPHVSGHMASSGYIVTRATTTYGQNVVGDGELLPSVEPPENDTSAIAAVAAPYAAYVEHGTVKMAAQPAFTPAFDKAAQTLAHALGELEAAIADQGIKAEG